MVTTKIVILDAVSQFYSRALPLHRFGTVTVLCFTTSTLINQLDVISYFKVKFDYHYLIRALILIYNTGGYEGGEGASNYRRVGYSILC